MARVTVEDCVDKVESRFDLVLYSAFRSREIAEGAELQVDRENDKNPVVELREIAENKLDSDNLEEELIESLLQIRHQLQFRVKINQVQNPKNLNKNR